MCLRFQFCTHQRVCILYFLKKSQIRCTLLAIHSALICCKFPLPQPLVFPPQVQSLPQCRSHKIIKKKNGKWKQSLIIWLIFFLSVCLVPAGHFCRFVSSHPVLSRIYVYSVQCTCSHTHMYSTVCDQLCCAVNIRLQSYTCFLLWGPNTHPLKFWMKSAETPCQEIERK